MAVDEGRQAEQTYIYMSPPLLLSPFTGAAAAAAPFAIVEPPQPMMHTRKCEPTRPGTVTELGNYHTQKNLSVGCVEKKSSVKALK